MKKQQITSLISVLEPQVNLISDYCLKKDKKKNCCDKISRKGRYCKKCPVLKG